MKGATVVRKLSAKVIMGDKPKLGDGKKRDLFKIAGICRRVERGESTYGEWVRFVGNFIATNLDTGEVFVSNKCHLPDIISIELEQAVAAATSERVDFALLVSIIADDKSATGYVYHVEPIEKIKESSDVAALAAKIGVSEGKSLPAPADKSGDEKGKDKTEGGKSKKK